MILLFSGTATFRSITVNGEEVEFSGGFTDLHTKTYQEIIDGNGFTPDDCRPSIQVAHDIRIATPTGITENSHPLLLKQK